MATKKSTSKKKAAAKAPAEFNTARRADYAPGTRVKVMRKTGEETKGKVHSVVTHSTGPQIYVNTGTDEMPRITAHRPVNVKAY